MGGGGGPLLGRNFVISQLFNSLLLIGWGGGGGLGLISNNKTPDNLPLYVEKDGEVKDDKDESKDKTNAGRHVAIGRHVQLLG